MAPNHQHKIFEWVGIEFVETNPSATTWFLRTSRWVNRRRYTVGKPGYSASPPINQGVVKVTTPDGVIHKMTVIRNQGTVWVWSKNGRNYVDSDYWF